MSNERFYVVDYNGGPGLPQNYVSGEFNVDEWEWDEFDPLANKVKINEVYKFKVLDESVSKQVPDFFGSPHNIVSDAFLGVCDKLGVKYFAVPVEVLLTNPSKLDRKYFIFVPLDAVQLLDEERSNYCIDKNLETGNNIYNIYHPSVPAYSWIKTFAVKKDVERNFFICIEIMKWVCSEEFKTHAQNKLIGLGFTEISQEYSFNPWGEMP